MNQVPVIVALVPPSSAHSPAVRRAAELARRSGATLHLCNLAYDPALEGAGSDEHIVAVARRAYVDAQSRQLDQLATELAHADFTIECEVLWAPVRHEALIAKVLETRATLVVADLEREPTLLRSLFTPLDWKLIRLLPCELMLVGPNAPATIGQVLAAVDVLAEAPDAVDGLNERIVGAANRIAELASARLDLVAVVPWHPVHTQSALTDRHYTAMEADHLAAFRRFTARLHLPEDRCHRPAGDAVETIIKLAKQLSAELTVVGSYYRSGWDRLLLGSAAEALLQGLPTDLLVVRPKDFVATLAKHLDLDALRARVTNLQPA